MDNLFEDTHNFFGAKRREGKSSQNYIWQIGSIYINFLSGSWWPPSIEIMAVSNLDKKELIANIPFYLKLGIFHRRTIFCLLQLFGKLYQGTDYYLEGTILYRWKLGGCVGFV